MRHVLLAIFATLLFTGCAREPKDSYVDRVRTICGDRIAEVYSSVKWRERDYAHDSLLVTCIVFGDATTEGTR